MLNAVLFDLDNTLVDRDRAFHECVRRQFSDREATVALVRLDARGHGNREALLEAWTRHSGASMTLEMLGMLIAEQLRPDLELLSELRALSVSTKIGVITNGGSASQRGKFRAAGLDTVIAEDHLWISAEVGRAKPDCAIFRLASDTLGVRPERCLHIGDHPGHDQAGALAAGMRARRVSSPLNRERLCALLREEGLS